MTTVHFIDGTSREHPGCTGHSEDGRLWITSGSLVIDDELFGDAFTVAGIMCASYLTDEIDWWTDREDRWDR